MHTFRQILETKLSQQKPSNQEVDLKTLQFLFGKIIGNLYGARGKSNVLPARFEDGVLTLTVYKSLWFSEVTLIREDLRESLNKEIGSTAVTEIRLQRK